jgi:SAM-dependent methyltransferase
MAAPERPDRRRPEHRAQRWPGTGADRERLASTFNSVAKTYQRARPDYPEELFGELIATTRLSPGDRVLEIGCATGKATLPLARRGFEITCIEPGPDLVVAARRNLVGLGAEVILGHFEDWDRDLAFDLVFAATAWQWVDPKVRYRKAWESLRRGGHLAFWDASHVFPDGGDPFFRELQEVYEEIGEGLPPDANPWPRPGELPDRRSEIEAGGLFEVVLIRHFDWERVYDAEAYLELLDTFSGHIAMKAPQRDRLYGEIRRRLVERSDRSVRRHWGAVLHVARRWDDPLAAAASTFHSRSRDGSKGI